MLSNRKRNRIGSESGGCPQPVVFSSLKRPANASTTKTAMKESKIPKIPASRSGAHSLPKSNKSNVLSASNSKHNQNDQADIFQKSAALQGSFKNTKSSENKAKAGSDFLSSAAKPSQQHPRRYMTNLALEEQASTNPQATMIPKANCGLATFPAGVLPSTESRALDAHHVSKKTGFLLPQSTQCIDGNIRSTQFQTTKPSGLRMPLPSLGFFGQSKTSASNSSDCFFDNKLRTSEVHDQYLVVDDDNKKSGEPPDPQSHSLLIEQIFEFYHGSLLHDYLMLSKSTPAEESHGVHGLEIALNVIPVKDDDLGVI